MPLANLLAVTRDSALPLTNLFDMAAALVFGVLGLFLASVALVLGVRWGERLIDRFVAAMTRRMYGR